MSDRMSTHQADTKVLLTGATGFIGGTVLTTLLTSSDPQIQSLKISVLIRNPSQASYFNSKNINTISFRDLEDVSAIQKAASEHDIVIDCASGFATNAARALIQGLGERKRTHPNRKNFIIHTSGTSNVGDRPITKEYVEPRYAEGRPFLDTEDIDGYMRKREELEAYPQRTTDVVVVDTGKAEGVDTYIMMPPTIWGKGTGHFHKRSMQVPVMAKAAMKHGFTPVIGKGEGGMDNVHVEDLAHLYEGMTRALLAGEKLPSGKEGIYFCETGTHTWREVAEGIAKTGKEMGVLSGDEVREVSLDEAVEFYNFPSFPPRILELGFASSCRTRTTKAKALWEPRHTKEDFMRSFKDEFEVVRGDHE